MIWETIPHNQYLGPFGSTLDFLILGSLGALASACYIIQGPNLLPNTLLGVSLERIWYNVPPNQNPIQYYCGGS